ncbi:MAG: nuclear transport factor 2 family protein [Melioribacteraceae bacterium]
MKKTKEVLTAWLNVVNKGEIENILALYNENAVLIPTFSNRVLDSRAKIRSYFEQLRTRDRLSVDLHEKFVNVQKITETIYALSGIYCWRFAVDGELLSFEARFSFVLDLSLTSPIIHHHSSQIPRML